MKTTYTGWGKAVYSKNYKKLMNFVKTERGREFVSKLHTERLTELAKQFNCPFVLFFKNDTKNYKLIQKACDDNSIIIVKTHVYPAIKPNIIDYNHFDGSLPKNLTSKEMKSIENNRPKSKMGEAEKFHRLEDHKMGKWEKKHPRPTEKQLKGDLFPQTLLQGWQALRDNRSEDVRNWILLKYYKNYVPVIGRIQNFNTISEKIIGFVQDTYHEITKINDFAGDIDDKPTQVVKKAYAILNDAMTREPHMICGRLESRDKKFARILVPNPPRRYANGSAMIQQIHQISIAA